MVTDEQFKQALSHFPSGVTVLSAYNAQGQINGLTVSSFCSLSLSPPLILACLNYGTRSYELLSAAPYFSVNILAAGQEAIAYDFAKRGEEKLAAIAQMPLSVGELGTPVLQGAMVTLECKRLQESAGGDHAILMGEVQHSIINENTQPMVYCQGVIKPWPELV